MQIPEERGSETRKKARAKEEKGVQSTGGEEDSRGGSHAQRGDQGGRSRGSEDVMMDVTNGAQLPPTQAQIPSTLTQVYLAVLGAFLSRDAGKRGINDKPKTTRPPQR